MAPIVADEGISPVPGEDGGVSMDDMSPGGDGVGAGKGASACGMAAGVAVSARDDPAWRPIGISSICLSPLKEDGKCVRLRLRSLSSAR